MRPGRLDKLLYVGPPDKPGRVEILRIRTRKMSVDPELDLDVLADLVSLFHNPVECCAVAGGWPPPSPPDRVSRAGGEFTSAHRRDQTQRLPQNRTEAFSICLYADISLLFPSPRSMDDLPLDDDGRSSTRRHGGRQRAVPGRRSRRCARTRR